MLTESSGILARESAELTASGSVWADTNTPISMPDSPKNARFVVNQLFGWRLFLHILHDIDQGLATLSFILLRSLDEFT
jgi:hypothetical protein